MSHDEKRNNARRDPEGSTHRRGNTTPVQRSQARRSRRPEHRTSLIPRGNMPLTEGERPAAAQSKYHQYSRQRRSGQGFFMSSISRFASALAPSWWKEKFEKENVDPFGKVLIHPSSIPMWMVEAKDPSKRTYPGNRVRGPIAAEIFYD